MADFLLRDHITKSFTTVELKRSHISIDGDKFRLKLIGFGTETLCFPWNKFDFLLFMESDRRRALLFSRDELPDNPHIHEVDPGGAANHYFEVQVPLPDRLKNHTLVWYDKQDLAQKLESAFLRYCQQGRFRSVKPHPARNVSAFIARRILVGEVDPNADQIVELSQHVKGSSWRGSQARWSRKQYEASQQQILEKQLQTR